MASSQDLIFGQIGAAKMFCGKLSSTLEVSKSVKTKAYSDKIERLERQGASETDTKKQEKINNKIKKLQGKTDKLQKNIDKVNNAIDFLTSLAERLDMGKEAVIEFLGDVLVILVPEMEYTLKAVLLANIKKMTSCALDVSIPDWMRDEGILVNEDEIDPRHILFTPPMSKYGHHYYFGIDKPHMSSYELTKAEDMNAFIWFVKNCAKIVNPVITNGHMSDYFKDVDDNAPLKEGYLVANENGKPLTAGTVLKDFTASNTLYIVQNVINEKDKGKTYSITPLTCDNNPVATSVSWYTQNAKNKGWYVQGQKSKNPKPLFTLEYSNVYNSSAKLPYNNYRFRILQKPFMMGSSVIADLGHNANNVVDDLSDLSQEVISGSGLTKERLKETLSKYKNPIVGNPLPKKAVFNEFGLYDKKGRYSINQDRFYVINTRDDIPSSLDPSDPEYQNSYISYRLEPKDGTGVYGWLRYDKPTDTFALFDNEGHSLVNKAEVTKYIKECYKGTTVYEFNYDYVTSVKLFDEKVLASNVINALMGVEVTPFIDAFLRKNDDGTASSYNSVHIRTMINQMIQKILDSESEEYTSCFYNFSNEEYVKMEEETAMKVINGQLIKEESVSALTEAYNILDAYDAEATLNEKTETITRSIAKALESIDEGNDGISQPDKLVSRNSSYGNKGYSLHDLLQKAVRAIVQELTYAILSPKVLMLIAINKKLMHDKAIEDDDEKYKFSYHEVLGGMEGIISSVVKNIIDEVEKELLRVIMARITELMNAYVLELAKEYVRNWQTFLKSLLSCFKINRNRMSQGNGNVEDSISAILDKVDTADLDELVGQIMPDTNPC